MSTFNSFNISAAGLSVEKLRMETAALNFANANSTAPPGTEPFTPLSVVSSPAVPFGDYLQTSQGFPSGGAVQATVEPRLTTPRLVYEPAHPHADSHGMVAYANVDSLTEMVSMLRATRAYEANIRAINAAKAMAEQALDIGSGK